MNEPALTLSEVEEQIADHYRFFAAVAPGIQAQETGELGILWKIFDDFMEAGHE